MRTIGGLNGFHGRLNGQPASGREADNVEHFSDTQAFGMLVVLQVSEAMRKNRAGEQRHHQRHL